MLTTGSLYFERETLTKREGLVQLTFKLRIIILKKEKYSFSTKAANLNYLAQGGQLY